MGKKKDKENYENSFFEIFECINDQVILKAICRNEEDYEGYRSTRDMRGTKTIAINMDNPKCPFIDFDKLETEYLVYGDVNGTFMTYGEIEEITEAEGYFHDQFKRSLEALMSSVYTTLKFSEEEKEAVSEAFSILEHYNEAFVDFLADPVDNPLDYKKMLQIWKGCDRL